MVRALLLRTVKSVVSALFASLVTECHCHIEEREQDRAKSAKLQNACLQMLCTTKEKHQVLVAAL